MGLFSSLGDAVNVPKLEQAASTAGSEISSVAGGVINNVQNFAATNFNLPTASKLLHEAADKLGLSGLLPGFKNLSVAGAVSAVQIDQTISEPGVPANYYPGGKQDNTEQLKVIITQDPAISGSPNKLIFNVMPRITESGGADYDAITPIQHPGAIQKYRSSSARSWDIDGRLISRTAQEATINLLLLNMIRSWRMPFYGDGTAQDPLTKEYLGAPPPILTMTAYGDMMIGPVKCVLTHYSWSFPNDVDYITTQTGNAFPVIIDVSLSLIESWAPAEFSGFNLYKYKAGDLSSTGAFAKVTSLPAPSQGSPVIQTNAGSTLNTSEPQSQQASTGQPTKATAVQKSTGEFQQYSNILNNGVPGL